ncbi:RidA family protein [Ruegeria halocynthiae]|uniref:RidA family protein n=1 Tax=Ruegeria halocynthiae TaxID=985054 RepID=UPI000567AE67|nr:RidA family protein [Ruegeria halocynthiae]
MTHQSHFEQIGTDRVPTIVNPPQLGDPTPNGYSTAVVAPTAGRLAFISGQGGQDADGGLSPDFGTQVAQSYDNLLAVLDALGVGVDRVVKLTVYVVDHDMAKLGVLTKAVTQVFGDRLPAQTLVPVPKLAIDPMLFEVEAIVAMD